MLSALKVPSVGLAFSALAVTTLLVAGDATARETIRVETSQQTVPQFPSRRRVNPQSTTTIPQATNIAPQIPPRPDMCVPDYSWFDYDAWEWICVGHL